MPAKLITGLDFSRTQMKHFKWDIFCGRSTVRGTKSIGFVDSDNQSKTIGASIFTHHLMEAFRQSREDTVGFKQAS
jgi:hypothetical protein